MRIVFEIENIAQLDEIKDWLADKKIVIDAPPARMTAKVLINRLQKYKVQLPLNYKFNRDEANER